MKKLFMKFKTWFKSVNKKNLLATILKLLPFLKKMKTFNRADVYTLILGSGLLTGGALLNTEYQETVKPKLDSIEIVDSTTTIINGVEFCN